MSKRYESISTILTINTKDPKTRVTFSQPLCSISEIQLVDYDFPETYEKFEADQVIKTPDGSKTLLTISASSFNYKTIRIMIIMSNLGINIHPTNDGYCISSKDNNVVVTRELAKVLGIPSYLFKNKYYPVSWPRYKYHIHCDIGASNSVLGLITTENKLAPTNLLAIIPSKSGMYPSIQVVDVNDPINYITLSVLDENGNEPRFAGEPFRISLRILFND